MKTYLGCFLVVSVIAIVLALVLGAGVSATENHTVFLPVVQNEYRECRLVLFEDNSWFSPDYSPSEGFPPDPPCTWVFEEGGCDGE